MKRQKNKKKQKTIKQKEREKDETIERQIVRKTKWQIRKWKNTTTQKDKKKNEKLIDRRNDWQINRKQCKKTINRELGSQANSNELSWTKLSFWTVWNLFGQPETFLDGVDIFWTVWISYGLTRYVRDSHKAFMTFWKDFA